MLRLLITAGLIAAFVIAKVLYDRRATAIADRSSLDLPRLPDRLLGPGRTWVVFSTEFCATCGPVADRLRTLRPDETVHKLRVEDDPELADSYAVRTAPTLLEVDASGAVVHSVAGAEHVLRYVGALPA